LEPILDLGLRLGEGTGALTALPVLRSAALLMAEVALLRICCRPPPAIDHGVRLPAVGRRDLDDHPQRSASRRSIARSRRGP
jgi:hypothetical protein